MPDTDFGQISLFSMYHDRCKSPFEFIHLENLFNLFPLEIVQKVNIANFVKMQVRCGILLFFYSRTHTRHFRDMPGRYTVWHHFYPF